MKQDYDITEDDVRRWARHILESHNIPLTKENVEELTETIICAEWQAQTYVIDNANDIFKKTYQNIYAEMQNKDEYYDILISCPHTKNKNSIKKIKMLNKHLLIHVGEREYRYQIEGREYIMHGLACVIYLPLLKI